MNKNKFDANAFYERLYEFAKRCQGLTEELPKTRSNFEYLGQLYRSSGSMGSNYIEALEATSKKDFIYRLKICRKETRESVHWLRLLDETNHLEENTKCKVKNLINEGRELMKIFTSSILTSEGKKKLENR